MAYAADCNDIISIMHNSIMNVLGTKQASANPLCKNPWVLHPPQISTRTDYCSEEPGLDDGEILK